MISITVYCTSVTYKYNTQLHFLYGFRIGSNVCL